MQSKLATIANSSFHLFFSNELSVACVPSSKTNWEMKSVHDTKNDESDHWELAIFQNDEWFGVFPWKFILAFYRFKVITWTNPNPTQTFETIYSFHLIQFNFVSLVPRTLYIRMSWNFAQKLLQLRTSEVHRLYFVAATLNVKDFTFSIALYQHHDSWLVHKCLIRGWEKSQLQRDETLKHLLLTYATQGKK